MRLPNFLEFKDLNRLRRDMGIPPNSFGKFQALVEGGLLTSAEIECLIAVGLLIGSLRFVRPLNDGTLAYKNYRVFCFAVDGSIRTKIHIANCPFVREMRMSAQSPRFAVACGSDDTMENHTVCADCLGVVNLDDFRNAVSLEAQQRFVADFSLDRYFAAYQRALPARPAMLDLSSHCARPPAGETQTICSAANWTCERCRWRCLHARQRKFLHVHRPDVHDESSRSVLCLSCHSEEARHASLTTSPDYVEFLLLKFATGRRHGTAIAPGRRIESVGPASPFQISKISRSDSQRAASGIPHFAHPNS
jgi:hypothetical protein